MPTVKLIFKPSSIPDKEGSVYLRFIHRRKTRFVNTTVRLLPTDWSDTLTFLPTQLSEALVAAKKAISECEDMGLPFTVDDVVAKYLTPTTDGFIAYGNKLCERLQSSGATHRAENYAAAIKRFTTYLKKADISFDTFNADLLGAFENELKKESLTPNTTSFYMRNLRAVFNRAVEEGLTPQTNPFRHVFTGVAKTAKRAIPLCAMKRIKEMPLKSEPLLEMARDVFMMSFLTRGMSIVDLAHLRKENLKDGYLRYRRQKTGQMLSIKWEKQMQEIVDKYADPNSPYLLPLINDGCKDTRKRYRSQAALINRRLKEIGSRIGLTSPLTLYVARHTWASAAFANNIPISVISEGMGHDSEKTTRIYLASLDTSAVDSANSKLINLL